MSALSLNLDTPDVARHYEQVSFDRQFKAGQFLVERLRIGPGEHVLDVGSGTGLLAEHVASIVGSRGSVSGIDPLPLRIEIIRELERSKTSEGIRQETQRLVAIAHKRR